MLLLNPLNAFAPRMSLTTFTVPSGWVTPRRNVGVPVTPAFFPSESPARTSIGVFPAVQTLLELRRIQADCVRVAQHLSGAQVAWVREEPIVHRPVLVLIRCAVGGLGRLEGLRVKGLQWKVANRVA